MVALQVPEARALRLEATDAANAEAEAVVQEGIGDRQGTKVAIPGEPVPNGAQGRGAVHLGRDRRFLRSPGRSSSPADRS